MATRWLRTMEFKPGSLLRKFERHFLGSAWTFIETREGEAFWFHQQAKKMIPSSRNFKLWEQRSNHASGS